MDTITRIRCFLTVVDTGGFSAAARTLGRSKALVSKYVGELEDELGVRLLNRTTRQISLTEVGQAYYREAGELLQRFDDLKDSVQTDHKEAQGTLRVSAPRSIGDLFLTQAMVEFLQEQPKIKLDLALEDRFVDIVEEGYDVAIRITELADSSLIARRLHDFRTVICATPEVLEKHGVPDHPSQLSKVPCIIDTNRRTRKSWIFMDGNERFSVNVDGPIEVNSATTSRRAAMAGLGFLGTPEMFVHRELQEGALVRVLEPFEVTGLGIYAVYPHRRHLSGKVRAFVDFMVRWFKEKERDGSCPNLSKQHREEAG